MKRVSVRVALPCLMDSVPLTEEACERVFAIMEKADKRKHLRSNFVSCPRCGCIIYKEQKP